MRRHVRIDDQSRTLLDADQAATGFVLNAKIAQAGIVDEQALNLALPACIRCCRPARIERIVTHWQDLDLVDSILAALVNPAELARKSRA